MDNRIGWAILVINVLILVSYLLFRWFQFSGRYVTQGPYRFRKSGVVPDSAALYAVLLNDCITDAIPGIKELKSLKVHIVREGGVIDTSFSGNYKPTQIGGSLYVDKAFFWSKTEFTVIVRDGEWQRRVIHEAIAHLGSYYLGKGYNAAHLDQELTGLEMVAKAKYEERKPS